MKVCFLSFEYPPKIIGGMGTYAEYLVRGLEEKGVDTYIITRGDKTCRDNKIYRISVSNMLYWRRFFFFNRARSLFHSLNNHLKFDLVHLNGTYPIIRGLKIPTVSTLHSPPNIKQAAIRFKLLRSCKSVREITYLALKNPVGSIFDLTTVQASDRIICPSPGLAKDIMLYCHADKQKIQIILNGIDLKTFDETKCDDATPLDHYNIQKENFLLYVGRLSCRKGVQYLIKAFKIVQNEHPNLKLVIVGTGDYEQQLRKIALNTKGVIFTGYVEDEIRKLLYDASLMVILPSVYEVLPITILEGMASSKPIIASNIEGNNFMVKHGKNGFLSNPKDPVNLAELINTLIDDKVLRKKFGSFGRKIVEKEFTMEKMVHDTLKSYEILLE